MDIRLSNATLYNLIEQAEHMTCIWLSLNQFRPFLAAKILFYFQFWLSHDQNITFSTFFLEIAKER